MTRGRKLTHAEYEAKVKELGNGEYSLLTPYKNTREKVRIRHDVCGFEWDLRPDRFYEGSRCKRCRDNYIDTSIYKRRIHERFGREFSLLTEYKKASVKVKFKHNVCGHEFWMTPNGFDSNKGCPKCNKRRRYAPDDYKEQLKVLTDGEIIPLEDYVKAHAAILHKHVVCGHEWRVSPTSIRSGSRCPRCYGNIKVEHEAFLRTVKELVGYEYTVLSEYTNRQKHIKMRHENCGTVWDIAPGKFKAGRRCPKCSALKIDKAVFEERLHEAHNGEYALWGDYHGNDNKVTIEHLKCGELFEVIPRQIVNGTGCPKCSSSYGEMIIESFLEEHKYQFKREFSFPDLKLKKRLRFDFALLSKNVVIALIEYDGRQHFEPVEVFGGKAFFDYTVERDKKKNEYCKRKNIPLIRIPYYEKNIKERLKTELNKLSALT